MARASVVLTDVDGTLMDSAHRLPAANLQALRRCCAAGVPVVLATGKHRGPWVRSLLMQVADEASGIRPASPWTLNAPGVFVQGLLVCDAAGGVVRRWLLPRGTVELCLEAAGRRGWTLLAYTDQDQILSNRADPQVERLRVLQEPLVEVRAVGAAGVHKLLFLGDPASEGAVREEVTGLLGGSASVTVAIPGMVEVLPLGTSKADGARAALELLGCPAAAALALGDGENDVELLRLIQEAGGMAVAVGNARQALKDVASAVVSTCDEGGWAEAVERWVLGPLDQG